MKKLLKRCTGPPRTDSQKPKPKTVTDSQKQVERKPIPVRNYPAAIQQLLKLATELQERGDATDASGLKDLVQQFVSNGADNVKWWTDIFKMLKGSPKNAVLGEVNKVLEVFSAVQYVGPVFKIVDYIWKWADQIEDNNSKIAEVLQKMLDMVNDLARLEETAPRLHLMNKGKLIVGINLLLLIHWDIGHSKAKKVFYSGVYAEHLTELDQLLQGVHDEFIRKTQQELLDRIAPLPDSPKVQTLAHMVGLGQVDTILSLLELESKADETILVLVHGMGGIGKTELANKVYEKVRELKKFRCCLLKLGEDARDDAVCDQQELFAKHLGCSIAKTRDKAANLTELMKLLEVSEPVMVRLDDVWYPEQVPYVLPLESFPKGSRLIITSRNAGVTRNLHLKHYTLHKHSVGELGWEDAATLFAHHVCLNKPGQTLESMLGTHARDLLEVIGGLPLALEVVGARLNDCPKAAAKVLESLKTGAHWEGSKRMHEVLSSCLSLLDTDTQEAFPAVAFMRGLPWACVEACFGYVLTDLERLALVKKREDDGFRDVVWMHDVLAAGGRKLCGNKYLVDSDDCSDPAGVLGVRITMGQQVPSSQSMIRLRYFISEDGLPAGSWSSTELQMFYAELDSVSSNTVQVRAYHNLITLVLRGCKLWQFPIGINDLKCLKHLDLSVNELSGGLPKDWSALKELRSLDLSGNLELCGELPKDWSALVKLQSLTLVWNQLSGELPKEWSALKDLQTLELRSNQLSGELPTEWSRLVNLKHLYLSKNQLSGKLPTEWSRLANLEHLSLSRNQLSGELPTEWSALVNLEHLSLSKNQLSGELPTEWSELVNLKHLKLRSNNLSGELPKDWSAMVNMEQLELGSNNLSGEVLESWVAQGKVRI